MTEQLEPEADPPDIFGVEATDKDYRVDPVVSITAFEDLAADFERRAIKVAGAAQAGDFGEIVAEAQAYTFRRAAALIRERVREWTEDA